MLHRMIDPVQLLEDREAIAEVVRTYARSVDRRDFAALETCFAPDLQVLAWGPGGMDRAQTIEYISGVAIFRETMHMMGNQLVHVDGDRATALTQSLLSHRHDEWPDLLLEAPRYVERLERRPDGWTIVERGGSPVVEGPGMTGARSDDPAAQWLLDRAAVADVLSREGLEGDPIRFLSSRLVEVEGDDARAWSTVLVLEPTTERRFVVAELDVTPTLDRLVRSGGTWRVVDRAITTETPSTPPVPTSADPRVRRLLDLAAVRDAVVAAGWGEETTVANNHRVEVDGDRANAESYVYRPPAWGAAPVRWRDRLERRPEGWALEERTASDNRMPDSLVR